MRANRIGEGKRKSKEVRNRKKIKEKTSEIEEEILESKREKKRLEKVR